MEIEITKKFQKQVSKNQNPEIKNQILGIIKHVSSVQSIAKIKNLKKLSGFQNKYRIRIHDYRIGLKIEKDKVIFAAFDHRSDIYKYFP